MMNDIVFGLLAKEPEKMALFPWFNTHPLNLRQPSPTLDRSAVDFSFDVDDNQTLPVCTGVALANSIRAFAKFFAGLDIVVPEAQVWKTYTTTVGCADTYEAIAQTQGAVYADMVNTAQRDGIRVNEQLLCVPKASILNNSITQLAVVTEYLATANIGIRLYDRDMQNIASNKMLDDDGSDPGSLSGRHMTNTWDYQSLQPTGVWRINLWRKKYPVTSRWIQARLDESWAHLYRNLLAPDQVSSYDGLKANSLSPWR